MLPKSVQTELEFGPGDEFSVPLGFKGRMAIAPDVEFDVAFGNFSDDPERDIRCDLEGMEKIYGFVSENLLPRFTCFFAAQETRFA